MDVIYQNREPLADIWYFVCDRKVTKTHSEIGSRGGTKARLTVSVTLLSSRIYSGSHRNSISPFPGQQPQRPALYPLGPVSYLFQVPVPDSIATLVIKLPTHKPLEATLYPGQSNSMTQGRLARHCSPVPPQSCLTPFGSSQPPWPDEVRLGLLTR